MRYKPGQLGASAVYTFRADDSLNVLDAAKQRVAYTFDQFDTVLVSVSGGKDSTCVLNLAYEEAQRREAKLRVVYLDEEIIDPYTEDYLKRVRQWPDIDFYWFTVPLRHTLHSKNRESWWTWDPECAEFWVREKPEGSISEVAGYDRVRANHAGILYWAFPPSEYGRVAQITGIRIDESPNRRRAIANAGSFITQNSFPYTGTSGKGSGNNIAAWSSKVIYDWSVNDVWHAISYFGWDYSHIYDALARAGRGSLHTQRVSSWGNVSGAKDLELYKKLFPDIWVRALQRLPELRDMAELATTKLYRKGTDKPPGLTWQEWCYAIINSFPDAEQRQAWLHEVEGYVSRWKRRAGVPLPEAQNELMPKQTWKFLCFLVSKNDLSGRDI